MTSYGDNRGVVVEVPVEELDAMLADLRRRADGSVERILETGCELLIGEASAEDFMPYDTGDLSRSRFNQKDPAPSGTFKGQTRIIGYQNDYGLVVHETHKTKKRWLTRKILERARPVFDGLIRKEFSKPPGTTPTSPRRSGGPRRDAQGRFIKGGG